MDETVGVGVGSAERGTPGRDDGVLLGTGLQGGLRGHPCRSPQYRAVRIDHQREKMWPTRGARAPLRGKGYYRIYERQRRINSSANFARQLTKLRVSSTL
jgi:hypothetical protein